jgi:hypothetical protein
MALRGQVNIRRLAFSVAVAVAVVTPFATGSAYFWTGAGFQEGVLSKIDHWRFEAEREKACSQSKVPGCFEHYGKLKLKPMSLDNPYIMTPVFEDSEETTVVRSYNTTYSTTELILAWVFIMAAAFGPLLRDAILIPALIFAATLGVIRVGGVYLRWLTSAG